MAHDELEDDLDGETSETIDPELPTTPVIILFTDIKGSISYFERHGDVAGRAWVQHHNELVYPIIKENDGRVVKMLGDSTMAAFNDRSGAIKAAVGMQRILKEDRAGKPSEDQIHIRVALHTGRGLVQGDDIFGEVVSDAAHVQEQAAPDQIVITEFLVDDARDAGFQCANLGRPLSRSALDPIDIYALAWSDDAGEELIEGLQARYEARLESAKRRQADIEEEFERARDSWRIERRKLASEIENFEDDIERAKEGAFAKVSEDLQAEIRFELEEAERSRKDLQEKLHAAEAKWDQERNNLKAQIASMQGAVIEAMERSNNPTRMSVVVREQVDARLIDAKQEWQMEFEVERRQLQAEINRLKRAPGVAEEKKDSARRSVLEKLGKLPPGSGGPAPKTADQWERELENSKIQWDTERDYLNLKVQRLETEAHRGQEAQRTEIQLEVRSQYEVKLLQANGERERIARELEALTIETTEERRRLNTRVEELERSVLESQAAARTQVTAELTAEFEARIEESERQRGRAERKLEDAQEELEAERRRSTRRVEAIEDQLKEARQAAARAQRKLE